MSPPVLDIRGLHKRFSAEHWVIDDLSLSVSEGELLCVLGSSGCGKTTMLRLISGFEVPDRGEIVHQGRLIAKPGWGVRPERRRIGMVFQNYALFPHMTVRANVRFGLEPPLGQRIAGWFGWRTGGAPAVAAAEQRVAQLMEMTGLTRYAERYPHELSGGQLQRIALARALAPGASLMLLDEPFSNLDANLRSRLRLEVHDVLKQAGVTAILVTHDQEEALNLADRIAVMNRGRIEQIGRAEEILHQPRTRFVARFTGMSDLLPGRVEGGQIVTDMGCLPIPGGMELGVGERVEVLMRPSYLHMADEGDGVAARIERIDYLGVQRVYTLVLATGTQFRAVLPGQLERRKGDMVRVRFQPPHLSVFPMEY